MKSYFFYYPQVAPSASSTFLNPDSDVCFFSIWWVFNWFAFSWKCFHRYISGWKKKKQMDVHSTVGRCVGGRCET